MIHLICSINVDLNHGDGVMGKEKIESVGEIDSGIACMGWSPDFEFVVLVTGNSSLIQMTNEWDVVTEVPLHPECPEVCAISPCSVSWRADGKTFAINCIHPETCLFSPFPLFLVRD